MRIPKGVRDNLRFLIAEVGFNLQPFGLQKISHFLTRLTFAPVAGHGPVFLQSIDVRVKGRAALLISLDVQESTQYSDFEYVGD